nr:hypothetical protein [Oscillospiraceae bacterium]
MKLFRLLTAILLSFLIVILAGSLYGALRVSALDTIYPNLSVDGISVGGLTRAEAVETLRANGREDSPSSPLTVTTIGGLSFTVDPALAGLAVSNEDAAALAWSYGRRDNPVKNLLTWIDCRLHPTGIRPEENDADRDYLLGCIAQQEEAFEALLGESEYSPLYEESRLVLRKGWGQLTMDTDGLLNAVIEALRSGTTELRYDGFLGEPLLPDFEAIYNELRKEPRDAVFTDDGRFEVIDEVVGCSFDIAAAVQLWEATAPAEEVSVPMEVTWPSV